MSHISIIRRFFCIFMIPSLFLILLSGCGGSSDDGFLIPPEVTQEEILEGIFVDAPVCGLTYYTASGSGTTNVDGKFSYKETDETITFSIAGIVLGRCAPKGVLTPVDLIDGAVDETDPAVTNISRLLLFMDSDGDPDNGITIPDGINELLAGSGVLSGGGIDFSDADFDNNANVQILINTMNAGDVFSEDHPLTLCTPEDAQSHLAETISIYGIADLEPTASIVFPDDNITITTGGSVYFQGNAEGGNPELTYAWDFGNGQSSTELIPEDITFTTADTYTVTFTATDSDGDSSSATVQVTVTEQNTQPDASIISPAGNETITAGGSVYFQGACSGGNGTITYAWDFGNGQNSTELTPGNITFTTPDTYTVSFTATDGDNESDTEFIVVTVTDSGIRAGVLQDINYNGDRYAFYHINLSEDLPATLLDDIDSVTITHQGGAEVCTLEDMSIKHTLRLLWARIPGEPMLGEYTFTIVAGGQKYILTDTQETNLYDLSAPDSSTFSPTGCIDTLPPELQCDPVDYLPGLYYELSILDGGWDFIYLTGLGLNTTNYTVPEGILTWNEDYHYRICVYDADDIFAANNRAISDFATITLGDGVEVSLWHYSSTDFDFSQFLIGFDSCFEYTAPDDIVSITIFGPSDNVNPILTQDNMFISPVIQDPVLYVGSFDGEPDTTGEYTINIVTTEKTYTKTCTHPVNRDIPSPDYDTLNPQNGATLYTTTPVFSWSPVNFSECTVYYNVWIYEYPSYNLIWVSGETDNSFVQIPEGILEQGLSYTWNVEAKDDQDNHSFSAHESLTFFISTEKIVEITSPSSQISIYAGGTVNFQASVYGDPSSYMYSWDFGNGDTSNLQNPVDIEFNSAGEYIVTLTAVSGGYTYTDTVTVNVFNPGDITIVPEHILEFAENSTDENFNKLMNDLPMLGDSEEANLYKALGAIAIVYNNTIIQDLISRFETYMEIDISLDTDFDAWRDGFITQADIEGYMADDGQLDIFEFFELQDLKQDRIENFMNQMTYDYLHDYAYAMDVHTVLEELAAGLDQSYTLLDNAEGIDTCITSDDHGTICIDSIDIHVLKGMVKILKALIIYLQSINVDLVNWNVTDPLNTAQTIDIRDLILSMPDKSGWTEEQEQQWEQNWEQCWRELAQNNPNAATYKNRSMLAAFRTDLEAGLNHYSDAVNELDDIGEVGRQARISHVFNLDTELQMEMALAIKDWTIPSIIESNTGCLDDESASITAIYPEEERWYPIDGGDGYYYLQETYDIYEHIGIHNPEFDMTAYGLLNPNGDKTLRDVISDLSNLPVDEDGNRELYMVYNFDEATKSIFTTITGETDNYLIESFEVPDATLYGDSGITIYDNSVEDWDDVPEFETINDITVKLAVDEFNDSVYILAQKAVGMPITGDDVWWNWRSSINITADIPEDPIFEFYNIYNESYSYLLPWSEEHFYFYLNAGMYSYDTEPSFNIYGFYISEERDEVSFQIPYEYRFVHGTEINSVEIRIDDSAYLLMREGSCQQINMSEYLYTNYYEYDYNYHSSKIYKLLPDITE